MKGFPAINSKGYNNMKDGRSKSAAFQKNGFDEETKKKITEGAMEGVRAGTMGSPKKTRTHERNKPDELKSRGLIQRDDGMIVPVKKKPELKGRRDPLKKDDIVQKNKQKQLNKKVNDLRGQWRNLKDRNSNKAKQLKKEASKIGLTLDQG